MTGQEQLDMFRALQRFISAGSRWRHWKGGEYTIVAHGLMEATGEAAVVYQSDTTGVIWIRPLSNFVGKVTDAGAPSPSVDRFVRIEAHL